MHLLHTAILPLLVMLLFAGICAFFSKTRGLGGRFGALMGFLFGPLSFSIVEWRARAKQTPHILRIDSENRPLYGPVTKTLGQYEPSRNETFQFLAGTVGLMLLAIISCFAVFSTIVSGQFTIRRGKFDPTDVIYTSGSNPFVFYAVVFSMAFVAILLASLSVAILVRYLQRRRKRLNTQSRHESGVGSSNE